MNGLRKVWRVLRKPADVLWASAVWLAKLVAHEEPVRVAGFLGGLGVALAARFGIDATVAQSVVPGVVAWLLAELARAQVTPAKGTVRLSDIPDLDPDDVAAQALAAKTPE